MPDTSEDLLPLGGYEEHRRKLGEERKKEYNDILRQLQLQDRAPQQSAKSDTEFSDFIGGHHSYIVEQQRKRWSDVDIKPYKAADTCFSSSLAVPRKKWIVPNYDHILNQKRLQESHYRRANDSVCETDLHMQEVSDSMSNFNKQPPQDEHNGGLLKQNKDMVAKRRLATDASPGCCQAAADSRNLQGCPDHSLTFIEPGLDTAGGSILDLHCVMLRQPVRQSLDPPPGLYYQPATYVTDKSAPKPYNFVDEAYNFFASHNPLDPGLSAETSYLLEPTLHMDSLAHALLNDISLRPRCCLNKPGSGFMQVVPPTGGEDTFGKWHIGSITEQKSLDDNVVTSPRVSELVSDSGPCLGARRRHYRTHQAPAVGMEFPSDANHERNLLQQQIAYRKELDRQLLEKGATRLPDTDSQSKCDFKSRKEVNYSPFGNDSVTQLKDHHDSSKPAVCHMTHNYSKNEENDHPINAHSSVDDAGQVVGLLMTDAQKIQAEKYMADLKKQIEEKQIVEYKKREQQRLEEEREQKILDEQRIQMQKEYEEEQRRIKEKAEEAKLKNGEIIKAAEERKRETERKDREAEKEREEKQEEKEIELKERLKEEETRSRAISPLIPTLRDKRTKAPEDVDMGNSLLTTTTTSVSKSWSTDDCSHAPQPLLGIDLRTTQNFWALLSEQDTIQGTDTEAIRTQLARMRRYLRNEHKRLQALLDIQEAYLY